MLGYIYWENSRGQSGYWYSLTLTIPFLDGNYSFWAYFIPRNEVGYSLFVTPPSSGSAGEVLEYSSEQKQRLEAIPYGWF